MDDRYNEGIIYSFRRVDDARKSEATKLVVWYLSSPRFCGSTPGIVSLTRTFVLSLSRGMAYLVEGTLDPHHIPNAIAAFRRMPYRKGVHPKYTLDNVASSYRTRLSTFPRNLTRSPEKRHDCRRQLSVRRYGQYFFQRQIGSASSFLVRLFVFNSGVISWLL